MLVYLDVNIVAGSGFIIHSESERIAVRQTVFINLEPKPQRAAVKTVIAVAPHQVCLRFHTGFTYALSRIEIISVAVADITAHLILPVKAAVFRADIIVEIV